MYSAFPLSHHSCHTAVHEDCTADANAHLRALLEGLVGDGDVSYPLYATHAPLTLADIMSEEPLQPVAVLEQQQAVPAIKFSCRFVIGDIAHNQAVMGQMDGGSGEQNDPVMLLSRVGRKDMGCLLLSGWRTLYENTAAYKGGPTGDGTQSLNMLATMGDARHSRGGHAHNVTTQMLARMAKGARDKTEEPLRADGYLKHEKMRYCDWMLCAIALASGGGTYASVQLTVPDYEHLRALCDLSHHLYADPDTARNRCFILSSLCAGIKFGRTLGIAYGDAGSLREKAKSQNAMMGLYPCTLVQLSLLTRIAPAAVAICEQHDGEFKPARQFHDARVNCNMRDTLTSFRRVLLASDIERRVNTRASKRVKDSNGKLRELYSDSGMMPPRTGSVTR